MFSDPGLLDVMAPLGTVSAVFGFLALTAGCLRWARSRAVQAMDLGS